MTYSIYIDGGSRGNPGKAASGVVFLNEKNEVVKTYSLYLGVATNNEAEYQALLLALKKAKVLFGKEKAKKMVFTVCSDSELLINQQIGKYKIKEPNLQKLFIEAWNLRMDFAKVNFVVIPREQNKKADQLVNIELDAQEKTHTLL